jgi:cobaltochelatase CobN
MGFGYSRESWGTASAAALRANLGSIDAVQFSRSSNLYGSLDNDDTYQYVGGLRTAVAQIAARAPDVFLHNIRQAGEEKVVSLREWLAVELHSRQLNPAWIQEMQRSGYAGAREISKEIEHLYGFQKTAPDHVNPGTWQTVLDVFVKDTYHLGLQRFFQEQNPHARQTVLARLLEVDRQRIQQFSAKDRTLLLTEYARSVARDGAACNAQVCGNVVLRRHTMEQLRRAGAVMDATRMDSAFRRALVRAAPVLPTRRPVARADRIQQWRTLTTYVASWTNPLRISRKITRAPWWVWIAFLCAYAAVVGVVTRTRRTSSALRILVHEDRQF